MNIQIYADGSDIKEIFDLYTNNKLVTGFTTNPSLMKKAGVKDYLSFIKEVTEHIKDCSISFEVFADDEEEMIYQSQKIAEYGDNIHVKIPITNTKGEYTTNVIKKLELYNKDLTAYSLETVQMFYNDAKSSNFTL